MYWPQYTKTQIENELATDLKRGLAQTEAVSRFLKYGPNSLPEKPQESWFSIFLRQFESPLIYILAVCSVVIYLIGEREDSLIILAVLLFNASIGAVQEGRSQTTLSGLKRLSQNEAAVLRDGRQEVVLEKEVVPGDIMVLQEGQKIVADARLIHSSNLSCDEAALTGESGAVHKTDGTFLEKNLPAQEQKNMVFKGTNVLAGNGLAVVVATGLSTEIGKVSKSIIKAGETEIPLQKNIRRLSQLIIYAVGAISAGLFFLGLLFGRGAKEMFAVVVSLAVSMIPEGLPLVLTLILVTGVHRMSKRHALIKRLQAVEALGQANILAVDKTGTITKNEMVVKKIFTGGKIYQITGNGYEPQGQALLGGEVQALTSDLELAAKVGSLASRATVRFSEKDGVFKVVGDPTEAAMQVLGEKFGFAREQLLVQYQELEEIPFDYKTKFRAVFYHQADGGVFCAASGAPEVLIEKAALCLEAGQHKACSPAVKKILQAAVEEFSKQGLRVVAFGYKILAKDYPLSSIDGLIFGGLYAMEDSVRSEVVYAITQAESAGVKVVMITGDHKQTAKAIAKEAGIFREGDEIITGSQLQEMSEGELVKNLPKVSIFARVAPEDKMKIIKAYKRLGLTVAMTGDGVNDAPSLVAADLGVAMGKIGTEVAREAADIVLLDDNLESIVAAIEEGRAMYKNIQKSLLFLFSTSLGELLTISAALVLRMPMPVLAVQILWLNLITDPLIGTALALDKKEPGLLNKGFQKLPKYFINQTMLVQMILVAGSMAAGTLFLFNIYHPVDYWKGITIALTALAVFQWYNGFNCQSLSESIFNRQIFRNLYLWLGLLGNAALQIFAIYSPYMQKFLKTTPLTWAEWVMILGIGFLVVAVEEVRKLIFRLQKNLKIN
ncbi:MAG: HAD-IC family P-type ATPase [Candidatus Doudnabacteria bacterium]|nr:HAD-IC family P-type ATPase [Candidatus Doudnabacteria bacterium]